MPIERTEGAAMPINVRIDGDVVVLSNFGRLLNDPRHFDAGRDVRGLLDEGHRRFVLDLSTLREAGDVALGLLTTLTRLIRQNGGEAVLANISRGTRHYLDEMRMDAYWEMFDDIEEAKTYLAASGGFDAPPGLP
jgi:anti-sigma B factor antagonist